MTDTLITIFTPTYNRKENLKDCYDSLKSQIDKDFIWQIIDDGSSDGTEDIVKNWISESIINIEYYKVPNGGKARAINKSLDLTITELWVCLDSDDVFIPDSISLIKEHYEDIKNDENVCGLFSLRGKDASNPMQGVQIPSDIKRSTQSHIRYQIGIIPEYTHVYKTDVAKRFKYPSIDGENYFPLSYVYDQIDQEYVYKIIHRPIVICEYKNDGLTKNKRKVIVKNPNGYMMYKKQLIKYAPTVKEKMKAASTYIAGSLLAKKNPFKDNENNLLTLVCYPIGLVDYLLRYKFGFKLDLEIKTKNIQ